MLSTRFGLLLLGCFFCLMSCGGCSPTEDIKGELVDGRRAVCKGAVNKFHLELGNITAGGSWGFEDEQGKIVVDCQYDEVTNFKNGKAVVLKRHKYDELSVAQQSVKEMSCLGAHGEIGIPPYVCGVIDENGGTVIKLDYHQICVEGNIFIAKLIREVEELVFVPADSTEIVVKRKRGEHTLYDWAGTEISEQGYSSTETKSGKLLANRFSGETDTFDLQTGKLLEN